MSVTHPLPTGEVSMLLCPSVHMLLTKKRSMNELYLLKHSVFMQLPGPRYQEDVSIVLFRLKKKYIKKKSVYPWSDVN